MGEDGSSGQEEGEGILLAGLTGFLAYLNANLAPGLEPGGYLEAMLQQVPPVYYGALLVSCVAVLAAWLWTDKADGALTEEPQEKETPDSFEISPDDECEFVPLSAEDDEARMRREESRESSYVPLDPDNPSLHLRSHLELLDSDRSAQEAVENFSRADLAKYLRPEDLHVLEDPRESPSRKGSLMSRVKKARQRALRNAVERDMTAEDKLKERMAANQMLARVYTVMRENEEIFGETSFNDVQAQMDLYKA